MNLVESIASWVAWGMLVLFVLVLVLDFLVTIESTVTTWVLWGMVGLLATLFVLQTAMGIAFGPPWPLMFVVLLLFLMDVSLALSPFKYRRGAMGLRSQRQRFQDEEEMWQADLREEREGDPHHEEDWRKQQRRRNRFYRLAKETHNSPAKRRRE